MTKNSGLGKGLEALFAAPIALEGFNEEEQKINEKDGETVKFIKITDIEPNVTQARKKFDLESLNELAESIKNYGILQPIIVEDKGNFYRIIAGERRWRASKIAGLEEIPCLVRDEDEQRNKEISLIENIQRENLNPIEKAMGYKELIDNYNLRQQDLADKLGISRTYVTNTLRILNLDKRVIELALEGKLTEGHCKALMAISDLDKQFEMATKIIETGGTVADIERALKNSSKTVKKAQKNEAIYRNIENDFEKFFGSKVKLKAGPRSGKIIISYSSNEELERLLEMVKNNG
ncbi:MAG: ParB/RepB/Spo0J family partition protein [Clostridiales bacterium]|nr:ParB/RepB/Spo0J family partition protein [Clostridiales bacterium]